MYKRRKEEEEEEPDLRIQKWRHRDRVYKGREEEEEKSRTTSKNVKRRDYVR